MDLNESIKKMYRQSRNRTSFISQENHSKKNPSKIEKVIDSVNTRPMITFNDLHGIEYIRSRIQSIVNLFKRSIEGKDRKSRWPALICGSRGIGKTALIEATANYAQLNFVPIQIARMVKFTRREFEDSLEQLIRHSIVNQPAIVLIDDLERIVDKEEYRLLISDAVRRLLEDELRILLFCTSSTVFDGISDIHFSPKIQLKRPTLDARLKILTNLRQDNVNLVNLTDKCLQSIAVNTPSFTPLDLEEMLYLAKIQSDGIPSLIHCEQAIDEVKQSFKRGTHLIGEKPQVTWKDIGGMSHVRQAFIRILDRFRRSGRGCKFAGIALYGPPGCGKTMVAQAMANEAGFNFISIKPAELVDKFLGETEKNIRRVFHEAREHEPCMIYFDEFDGLCGTRGNKDTVTSAIQTLLSEIDGFVCRGQSIILASTNRLEDIDPAMKRPGRLSKHIYVGPPDEEARRDILHVTTSKPWLVLADDVNLEEWARETDRFTGAEIDFLVDEAEDRAIDELSDSNNCALDKVVLQRDHFEYALNLIRTTNKELDRRTKRCKIDQSRSVAL